MPTGYTAGVVEGKDELADFVARAARGMGAFVMMRDDAPDAPLRLEVEKPEDSYYFKALKSAESELQEWKDMGKKEQLQKYEQFRQDVIDRNFKAVSEAAVARERIQRAIDEVRLLEMDPLLESFRDFMLQQLEDTLKHDGKAYVTPLPEDFARWQHDQEETLHNLVLHYGKSYREAENRYWERVKYAQAYRELFDKLGVELA